jgi:GTP-binding protein LepA
MENIRNFCIISHIDHGKSTLADRFLEITKTIPKEKMRPQFLDIMDLEREKGITIKMQPVRMSYTLDSKSYILNLIDTPGHVDFNYEVSRSLAAVEGGILLVDAIKGIQAQTLANLDLAKKQNLVVIPAVNKIDLSHAQVEETKKDITKLLEIPLEEVLAISAKYGTNVIELLKVVIEKVPPPRIALEEPLRALIFDSKYDSYKGVIAYVRVFGGQVMPGDKINLVQAKMESEVKEVGYFKPDLAPFSKLKAGEIGYVATGIKEPVKVRVGDTITKAETKNVKVLLGYKEPKPVVFASIYPENQDDFQSLKDALNKLKLNDASLIFEGETKEYLGRGFRCGFLGSLHAEIICERLRREFNLDLIISAPSVIYEIVDKKNRKIPIFTASGWPDPGQIEEIKEPWVRLEVITPLEYLGGASELLKNLDGNYVETKYFSQQKLLLIYELPLRKIIVGFHDQLKGVSQGFASMNYEILENRTSDLVKLEVLIGGEKEEAFPIQVAIGGKVIARETIKAKRRDVIAPLYGGDYTRKRKLLERQKKGKKKLKERGRVHIPPKVFLEMFKA